MKKNVFIIGDSYSTYGGYIPEGYHYYYGEECRNVPVVREVGKTWWKLAEKENNLNIVLNDSFSGSTVCNTVRPGLGPETAFIKRIDKYISANFFCENKIDAMFIFGGTNDSWIDAPIGEVCYSDWTEEELKCVLPAFCYLVDRAKKVVDDVIVIINTELKEEIEKGFIDACEKLNVEYLLLCEIDKENGHPTEKGMRQIADQVAECLRRKKTDYLVLVNEENPLPKGFEDTVEFISVTNSVGDKYTIEKRTYDAFLRLREDVLSADGIQIELISVYRTFAAQEETIARYLKMYGAEYTKKYVALPGCSEHQTGIAIDVGIMVDGKLTRTVDELLSVNALFEKVQKRLAKHGFILRYPEGKESVTKISYEPWHFRYVDSPEIASKIECAGICFEEYCERTKGELDEKA